MITLKTKEEIEIMQEGGRKTSAVLKKVLQAARPGSSLLELEEMAQVQIRRLGGEPAFKRVPGYNSATCLNVNEGIVHGLPSGRKLKEGDILSVDLGVYYKGFNTDSSWTIYVGDESHASGDKLKFLKTGEQALVQAMGEAKAGNRVRDISAAMQEVLEGNGYTPVDSLVGHGIGRELHEEPQIPCLVIKDPGPILKEGMTLAVEVIYTQGGRELKVEEDGWTVSSTDGSLSGLFEHTIVVANEGPIILTKQE
ncbi:type I methionyl aminopeptidase [Candidatus Saccharibacteria bacterium]|nr:type I methionyl aminopeptidase [Candidatus Saccharibacteria bacterium]